MKGFESKNVEISSNSELDGIDLSIDQSNMGFIFDIMFNQMYRDPIGSVIREITSNCFDSHAEAGVTDAVIINFNEDEGGEYISFQDFGVGISPDRMKNIYAKPASSTKRDTNDQIGYWGLGSKSPLAYTDSFEVITVSDKIKYHYIVHKGEKVPRIEKFDETPTKDRNGTIVKVYILNYSDRYKFEDKITKELRYFDNVFIKHSYKNFNNQYKIHVGETFKYRNDVYEGDTDLHICIGKVTYPIDWSKLGIKPIPLPFGLKFNIGELPITPERESIRYVSIEKEDGTFVETSEIIKNKIEEFKKEIAALEADFEYEHNNLTDYYNKKDDKPYITLLGTKIYTSCLHENDNKFIHVYSPVHELGIKLPPNPYFQYEVCKVLRNSKVLKLDDDKRKRVDRKLLNEFLVLRETKSTGKYKAVTVAYLNSLAREQHKHGVVFITKRDPAYGDLRKTLDYPDPTELEYGKMPNWRNIAINYDKALLREIVLSTTEYEYITVPEQFIEEFNKKQPKAKRVVEDGEVVFDQMLYEIKSNRKRITKVSELKNLSFVIYGLSIDEELLENVASLFRGGAFKRAAVVKIRNRDEKIFATLENGLYVRMFMTNNPLFKQVATAAIVSKSPIWNRSFLRSTRSNQGAVIRNSTIEITKAECANGYLQKIFNPLNETIRELETVKSKVHQLSSASPEFVAEVIEVAETNNWVEPEVVAKLKRVENYYEGLGLIDHVVISDYALPHVVDYFKVNGRKVNPEWTELQTWERQLLLELQEKFNYMSSLPVDYRHANSNKHRQFLDKSADNVKDITTILNYHDKEAITN